MSSCQDRDLHQLDTIFFRLLNAKKPLQNLARKSDYH
jgi:hypothetical protein